MPSDFSISSILGENCVKKGNKMSLGPSHSSEVGDLEGELLGPGPRYPSKHPLPKPAIFNGVGPKKFSYFREEYDDYASSMWGGDTKRWKRGLEQVLGGHPLSLYLSYMNQGWDYETIMDKLEGIFKGEMDPYMCRKLLELKLIKKENDETWLIFLSRVENLLTEIYPAISEEDKKVRMREILLQKFDNETAKQVVQMCMLQKDFSPQAVFDAATSLDSIPGEIMGLKGISDEVLNMAINTNKREEEKEKGGKSCLFCGKQSHYMVDCWSYAAAVRKYENMWTGDNLGNNGIATNNGTYGSQNRESRRPERRNSYNEEYRHDMGEYGRGRQTYNRNYEQINRNRGYSPYKGGRYEQRNPSNERYRQEDRRYGREDRDRAGRYEGYSPNRYRNEGFRRNDRGGHWQGQENGERGQRGSVIQSRYTPNHLNY